MIIVAISQNQKHLDKINGYLTDRNVSHPFFAEESPIDPHRVLTINGDIKTVTAVVEQERPNLLLLEELIHVGDDLQVLSSISARFPDMDIILMTSNMTQQNLLAAMRAGIRETLPVFPSREELLDAVDRFQKRIRQQASVTNKRCMVLAFMPCKGGSGATFLATNLAYTLAAHQNKRVALIDLNLQLGDATLFLNDNKPPATIADVARQIHRLDSAFLESSMLQILPNLGILAAPDKPEKALEIKTEHIKPLLDVAMLNHDFVILDVGRQMNAISIEALDKCDMIFSVMQQTLPYIRNAKRMNAALHSLGYSDDKLRLIVNRYHKDSEISLDDIENTLKIKIFKAVPNNFSVVEESVNHGEAVYELARRSSVAKSLIEFAEELTEKNEKSQEGKGWLKRIFSS